MAFSDQAAADRVREMREELGFSPEKLAEEIGEFAKQEGWKLGTVDASTIRRIEGNPRLDRPGLVPRIRVQVILALYFAQFFPGLTRKEIWDPGRRMKVKL